MPVPPPTSVLAIILAAAGALQPSAGAPPKQPVLRPIDKPPFEVKPPTTHAEKAKQMREAAQKRHDELKQRWADGYKTDKAPPPLQFAEPVKNIGKVSDDGKVEIKFTFKNVSGQSVVIKSAKPACGCTVAKLDKESYAPGEEGTILATYNPERRQGLEFKDIDVTLEDKAAPNLKIGFLVDTIQRVGLEPAQINLGEVRKGGTNKMTISVLGHEPGFDVTGASTEDAAAPFTLTRLDRTEETGEGEGKVVRVRYEAALKPGNSVAAFSTKINFATNDPKRPTVSVPLLAKIVGDIRVAPDRVFVVGEGGMPFSREIRLDHRTTRTFHILGVQTEGMTPGFRGAMDLRMEDAALTPGEASAYTLTFSGSLLPTGGSTGKIIVLTDVPDQSRIEIPVQGVVTSVSR